MGPLSVSQIQSYLACPLKYRFQYVDRIAKPFRAAALAFGTSVHAGVEFFHKERLAGKTPTLEQVVMIFGADWYAANLDPLVFTGGDSPESLARTGRDLLDLYVKCSDGHEPRSVEAEFLIDLVDPETGEDLDLALRGFIDLIEADGTLVDLKTAARGVAQGDLERHLQLSVYALVHYLHEGVVPKLRLDVLLKTKVPRFERYSTARTLWDLSWTARLVRSVANAIEARSFPPNPSWRCGECEYLVHCQRWRGE